MLMGNAKVRADVFILSGNTAAAVKITLKKKQKDAPKKYHSHLRHRIKTVVYNVD